MSKYLREKPFGISRIAEDILGGEEGFEYSSKNEGQGVDVWTDRLSNGYLSVTYKPRDDVVVVSHVAEDRVPIDSLDIGIRKSRTVPVSGFETYPETRNKIQGELRGVYEWAVKNGTDVQQAAGGISS
jgi:hypothetical protein